jgi:hypothetical protein
MTSLGLRFGGEGGVRVLWDTERAGLSHVAQKACVTLLTRQGSDRFLPQRGTELEKRVFSLGAFDFLGIQHALNFGALKVTEDVRRYEAAELHPSARLAKTRLALSSVDGNVMSVVVDVVAADGNTTQTQLLL